MPKPFALLLLIVLIASGCGPETRTPLCSDADVTDRVLLEAERMWPDAPSPAALDSIRTLVVDDTVRLCDCAADLRVEGRPSRPVTYTARIPAGGGEVVVEVFGR